MLFKAKDNLTNKNITTIFTLAIHIYLDDLFCLIYTVNEVMPSLTPIEIPLLSSAL